MEGKKFYILIDKKLCDFYDENFDVWELNSGSVRFKY